MFSLGQKEYNLRADESDNFLTKYTINQIKLVIVIIKQTKLLDKILEQLYYSTKLLNK